MCIVILSTAHPDYKLILLNNRDEYLSRPTAPLHWWSHPHSHVLGGRDLHRSERGTWLGITRDGRFAVLTNYREESNESGSNVTGVKSRGAMVNGFLTPGVEGRKGPAEFMRELLEEGGKGVGGFSLVVGEMGFPAIGGGSGGEGVGENVGEPGVKAAVVSNRTPHVDNVIWIAGGPESKAKSTPSNGDGSRTVALSNAAFGDRGWPKVVDGENLLIELIQKDVTRRKEKTPSTTASESNGEQLRSGSKADTEIFISECFELLNKDTLPPMEEGEGWLSYINQLRNSIFIPVIRGQGASADVVASTKVSSDDKGTSDCNVIGAGKQQPRVTASTIPSDPAMGDGSYGTMKQSVLLVDRRNHVTFVERTLHGNQGKPGGDEELEGDKRVEFDIDILR
ncbi:hypothetical protein MMC25_004478 [Agyrium rufum]|nr:hypothetical protein [Agyrium rufum]